MNSFTLECSFHGKLNPQTNKITHMSTADMQKVGQSLIKVIETYLPSQALKFQVICDKVFDIFYEEFIKFVPSYVLKREQ